MLLAVAAALVLAAPTATVSPGKKVKPSPAARLFHLTTHETFALRPNPRGMFSKRELRGWSRFLRCHHTQRVHFIAPRLAELIYKVARHFDDHRVLVVAGFRAPRVAREKGNPKSPHKNGVACDFRVEGVATTDVRDFVRGFARVGVGFYPNSDFVHLDVGRTASAFWVDYSGPGERSRYSQDPESDVAAERLRPLPNPEDPVAAGEQQDPPSPSPALGPALGGAEPQMGSSPGAVAPKTAPGTAPTPRED